MVPFDILSRTVMIATANPFDALGKEAVQQLLDYNVQWHLASPQAIFKVLGEDLPPVDEMSIKSFGERIADVLIEDGLLLPSQLAEAMDIQKKQGGRLLKLLTDKQYVTEQDMVISMGRCLDTPPINLSKVRVPGGCARTWCRRTWRAQYKLAPVCKLGNKLFVAMADPLNVLALDDLRQRTKLEIVPMITTERSVTEALSGVGSASSQMDQVLKDAAQEAADVEEVKQNREEIDLDRLAVESEDAPVVKIVNLILVQALKEKASDIHLEPFEKQFKLRYRVDGALIEASSPPKALQLPIASRIKILAGLDIAERRLPQDGRFRIRVSGKEVDLRISILPDGLRREDRHPSARQGRALRLDRPARHGRVHARHFQEGRRCAARHDPRHRPDRLGQDDHALFRAQRAEQSRIQHRHRRGPDRIPAPGHQPGRGESRHRPELRRRAALHSASGPGHRDDR